MSPAMRGWRFDGVALSGGLGDGLGPRGPLLTPAGGVATIADDAMVRQSIVLLLTTIPGERVMRPDYGCPLHRLIFAPNDATTAGLAIHYIRQALDRWEPRIDILRIDAGAAVGGEADEDGSRLTVQLDYRVRSTNGLGTLAFSVDLNGGGL
jgi:phage baseplate assembly protein W